MLLVLKYSRQGKKNCWGLGGGSAVKCTPSNYDGELTPGDSWEKRTPDVAIHLVATVIQRQRLEYYWGSLVRHALVSGQ